MRVRHRSIVHTALIAGAITLCAPAAFAQIPVGYVSWDVTFLANAGEFDIVNLTGPNALPPDFPILTTLSLSDLNLVVNFVGGGSATYGPSSGYFSLGPDGESFNGTSIPIGGTNPEPISATLTGTFSPLSIDDPSADTILSTFSALISPDPGNSYLMDGDLAVIYATEASVSTTPLPSTWWMMLSGLAGLGFVTFRYSKRDLSVFAIG